MGRMAVSNLMKALNGELPEHIVNNEVDSLALKGMKDCVN